MLSVGRFFALSNVILAHLQYVQTIHTYPSTYLNIDNFSSTIVLFFLNPRKINPITIYTSETPPLSPGFLERLAQPFDDLFLFSNETQYLMGQCHQKIWWDRSMTVKSGLNWFHFTFFFVSVELVGVFKFIQKKWIIKTCNKPPGVQQNEEFSVCVLYIVIFPEFIRFLRGLLLP